ncbi:cyanophycinase, partial [Ideonella sp.]|uniref:cyanophycinase n=1 Tax=Ideonella sp. TaxID=1929293 RepID=UPI003BB6143E
RFAVFATAAGNPERSAQLIGRALGRHGATTEHIAVAPRLAGTNLPEAVRDERWIKAVLSCQGVFFAGGAQERITDTLQPGGQRSPLLDAVWQVFNRGGVVAGTSAGAAIMSRLMFRDAQSVMGVLRGDLRMGKEIDQGLGFVGPALFIDQHFLKRGRIGRMLPLMQSQGYRWGLGVEENSAAIVQGGRIEVIGARGALLADLADATQDARLGAFNLRGATLSLLERGDRYDLAQRQFTPSATKQAEGLLNAQAPGFKPYFNDRPFHLDILGDNTIAQAMAHLIDNTASEVRGLACEAQSDQRLGFEFRLYKAADSLGWFSAAAGGEDYSVAHLRLDVQPVRMAPTLYSPWSS